MSANSPIVRSLDARYYTDPGVFETEKAGVLAETWQFAGHAASLAEPGDYFAFEIAGQGLFCVLGEDHEVRTFYNVCQHRAHELVAGRGNARRIVCPYHSWTYTLDGQLRSGLNLKSVPGLDVGSICLTPVRTEIFLGFIFVNLDPDAEPMASWFPDVHE